jgi:negative regulator of flagellin synthesis FlgM
MTEKINGQGPRPTDTAPTRRSEATNKAANPQPGHTVAAEKEASTGDTVNITRSGLLMSRLEEVVQRTPVVDAERVAALKEALASGKYEVDDQRVADQWLRFERDLLG